MKRKTTQGIPGQLVQIGSFARQGGVSVRAVRYYEELGLIRPETHSRGGFRLYGPENRRQLAVIRFLKEAGLPLTEIRRILLAKKPSGADRTTVRALLDIFGEKLQKIEAKIETLQAMKMELAKSLEILRACDRCSREVLLDAEACGDCQSLTPREEIPATMQVLLR